MDNDLLDMIAAGQDGSATDIHDKIKDLLYAKAAENVDIVKPAVTADMFGGPNPHLNTEEEPEEEESPGTPSSVEDTAEVEEPVAETEPVDDAVEEEQPEA
jgi:hypothetical protein|tara:strand:- start:19827 stop:20129 length:303 start_codon:yes stop_codon:yes gene_type:complete